MIVRDKPNLLRLFFIMQGSIVPRVLPHLIFISLLSISIVFVREHWPTRTFTFDGAPFSLVGIALSIFLGFRNSACYDRWWEGRKSWGQLAFCARDLSRKTLHLNELGTEAADLRRSILQRSYQFAGALVSYLQPEGPFSPKGHVCADQTINSDRANAGNPDAVLKLIARDLVDLRMRDILTDHDYRMLHDTVAEMARVQVICERLKNTPLPFGYTLLLHRTAYAFCFLIPFGFADTLGWGTPVVTALIAYTFFGLDALGDELEDPLGCHPNTLAIRSIASNIELEIKIDIGETELPDMPRVVDHVLV